MKGQKYLSADFWTNLKSWLACWLICLVLKTCVYLDLFVTKAGLNIQRTSNMPFSALTDRVKYHDLYLSTGGCSSAVNVILKPLYPLYEDLWYSRPHASRPALKRHYQQLSGLYITHTTSFHKQLYSLDPVPKMKEIF